MAFELTGRITAVSFAWDTGKPQVSLELNEKRDVLHMVDEFKEVDKLAVRIDKWKDKRSLNANNYAWSLITQIGNATLQSKDDVHFLMLKRYGQSEVVSVLSKVPPEQYFQYFEEIGESTLNGKDFKHYRVFKGSRYFNTKEMSIYIDGIVGEARDLGIPTDTPERIAQMKLLWEGEE